MNERRSDRRNKQITDSEKKGSKDMKQRKIQNI